MVHLELISRQIDKMQKAMEPFLIDHLIPLTVTFSSKILPNLPLFTVGALVAFPVLKCLKGYVQNFLEFDSMLILWSNAYPTERALEEEANRLRSYQQFIQMADMWLEMNAMVPVPQYPHIVQNQFDLPRFDFLDNDSLSNFRKFPDYQLRLGYLPLNETQQLLVRAKMEWDLLLGRVSSFLTVRSLFGQFEDKSEFGYFLRCFGTIVKTNGVFALFPERLFGFYHVGIVTWPSVNGSVDLDVPEIVHVTKVNNKVTIQSASKAQFSARIPGLQSWCWRVNYLDLEGLNQEIGFKDKRLLWDAKKIFLSTPALRATFTARMLIGTEWKYHFLDANCESFVRFCYDGTFESPQAESSLARAIVKLLHFAFAKHEA